MFSPLQQKSFSHAQNAGKKHTKILYSLLAGLSVPT
jgi:hypothetical protein